MGYFVRRVTGYFVFLAVLGALSTLAVNTDTSPGDNSLTGTHGAAVGISILFIALMASWIVRYSMRRHAKLRSKMRRARVRIH